MTGNFLKNLELNVACPARHIQIFIMRLWSDIAHEAVFPYAMQAAGHEVIHDVVFGCYRVENTDDFIGFFFGGDFFFAEPFFFWISTHNEFFSARAGRMPVKNDLVNNYMVFCLCVLYGLCLWLFGFSKMLKRAR